jgi:acyl-coenzyme A synthetase/AMP-(fatty) acid ligase
MGISKLVVHSHEKMLGNAANCITKYGFTPCSRATIPVPVAHMYGFGAEFLPAVMAGASIDLQEKTHLLKYLDRERQFQPNIVFATPTLCEILMKGYKSPRTNYTVFVTSGQRIGEDLFRSFDPLVNGRLINQYGSTEMGATAACDPGDTLDRRATTIGKPMPGVHLRLDPQPGEESGGCQLYCRHPYGYEGYVDEDGNPLGDIPTDGWYRTGDLALNAPDGSIVVTGRADASVNRRGYLVLLSDIERKMEKFAALRGVIVVAGRDENKQGQRIAAFCVPRQGAAVDGPELRRQCFDVLPHYAVPDEVYITEELPMLASGKVDRRSLAALVG